MKRILFILVLIIAITIPVFAVGGTYTTNEYFYMPLYGAYGTDEFAEYNAYMEIADNAIKANEEAIETTIALLIPAKVNEAGGITKGQPVYFSGATGQFPQVSLADNTVGSKTCVAGIAAETKTDGQTILVRTSGELKDVDTSAYSDGDCLYLSTAGSYSITVPTSGEVLMVAGVEYSHANQGKMLVLINRTKDRGAPADTNIITRLGDSAGVYKQIWRDYANEEIGSVDSDGNADFFSYHSNVVLCSKYDHPDNAITAIGADNRTLLVTESETCDVNFTVPANVTVRFERGGKWTINNGVTVTFNGQIDAGLWEIFAYTGTGTLAGTPLIGEVYPEWWGAVADGVTDDYTALKNCVAFANDRKWITLQSLKTYLIDTELDLYISINGVKFNGNHATIKAGGAMTNVVSIDTVTVRAQILNLAIDADGVATYGLYLYHFNEQNGLVQNCRITNAVSHGVYLRGCQVAKFENLQSNFNGGDGFLIKGCNGSIFDNIRAKDNTGNGVTIQNDTSLDGGCILNALDIEENAGHGVEVETSTSVVNITNSWFEANLDDAIIIKSKEVRVSGCTIFGGDAGNTFYAIYLDTNARGCLITGNYFWATAGTVFAQVYNNSAFSSNIVYPNFNRFTAGDIGTYAMNNLDVIPKSQYPRAFSDTYVKATDSLAQAAYYATDPTVSLTGSWNWCSWLEDSIDSMRFHIDLGSMKVIKRIYYENCHNSGGNVNIGVQNFTFWGSNTASAFAELTYGIDTNWTQITTISQNTFDQHTASDIADPKYITVTNATAYRYYAFKFVDNWGSGSYIGIRQIELQTEGVITTSELNVDSIIRTVITMNDGDATPTVAVGEIFISQANTAPTEITDLDNPTVGQIVTIIVGHATNPPTITDGGNFKLSANWTPDIDDVIVLFVKADNTYIELSRSAN